MRKDTHDKEWLPFAYAALRGFLHTIPLHMSYVPRTLMVWIHLKPVVIVVD